MNKKKKISTEYCHHVCWENIKASLRLSNSVNKLSNKINKFLGDDKEDVVYINPK